MRRFPFVFFMLMFIRVTDAQTISVMPQRKDTVPAEFLFLRSSARQVSDDNVLNEQLIDLVRVDEIKTRLRGLRWATHQTYLFNWVVRMLNYYWLTIDRERHRFVGTARHPIRIPNEEFLTEYDINLNLTPHLPHYIDFMYAGIKEQLLTKKGAVHDSTKAPYNMPTDTTLDQYHIHCELTPQRHLREKLNEIFYPCMPGPLTDVHPNFCDPFPTYGLYGPWVLDCNHSCHQEIHSYEWLWWLDNTVAEGESQAGRKWLVGFFREGSNRMMKWNRNPRAGTIAIPFLFRRDEAGSQINIDHLLTGVPNPGGLRKIRSIPQDAHRFNGRDSLQVNAGDFRFRVNSGDAGNFTLRWWLDEVCTDTKGEWLWGYLRIAVSTRDAWTARITVEPRN